MQYRRVISKALLGTVQKTDRVSHVTRHHKLRKPRPVGRTPYARPQAIPARTKTDVVQGTERRPPLYRATAFSRSRESNPRTSPNDCHRQNGADDIQQRERRHERTSP